MKFILTFEKFNTVGTSAEVKTDMTLFNNSSDNIDDYKKRKDQLSQIYLNYKEDDNPKQGIMPTDLYNKLLSGKFIKPGNKNNIQFLNPLFAQHAEFVSKERQTKNAQNDLANSEKTIKDTQQNIQNDQGNRETNNTIINQQSEEIKNKKKDLDTIKKDTKQLQSSSKKQIQNNIKDLEDAKKRLTKLSGQK